MQTNVTDEMIARYLSGVASPDEEAEVLDYMSENDDRLDNLLAMTAAIEQNEGGKQRKRVRPLWPAISAAACITLLLGVGLSLWHHSMTGNTMGVTPAPAYAEQDSIIEMEKAL